jgi:ribA/ribD-fused uncharacterized protein
MRYHLSWLIDQFDKGEYPEVILFWGHLNHNHTKQGEYMLSQWYPSPFSVNEAVYKSAGQWMMARKALIFGDRKSYKKIMDADTPDQIRFLGGSISGFDETIWSERKYEIVREGNFHKFNQNRKLRAYLMSTGNAVLAQANPFDKVWGIGLSAEAKNISDPYTWEGLNLLGFALMEIREYLRNFAQLTSNSPDSSSERSKQSVVI